LVDIVVTDENLHAVFLSNSGDPDTAMDGSDPDGNRGTNRRGAAQRSWQ
jgi:hypothetical protein